jgi:hypothetical protein
MMDIQRLAMFVILVLSFKHVFGCTFVTSNQQLSSKYISKLRRNKQAETVLTTGT